MAVIEKERPTTVAVLGGGAPHAALMAGALAYIYRCGKTFDVFYTSGGGALIGLLFVAPRGKKPDEALRDIVEFGVADSIYRFFPVGYKTFFKRSRYRRLFHAWAQRYKLDLEPRPFPGEHTPHGYDPREQRRRRLYNDWVDLWFSVLTPPDVTSMSRGLCAHLPFLEDMVDFSRVNQPLSPSGFPFFSTPIVLPPAKPGGEPTVIQPPPWFFVNAYNLKRREIQQFMNRNGGSLTPRKIRAALSFPFVYPPENVDGELYCEGADVDPLNLPRLAQVLSDNNIEGIPKTYLFDILGSLEKDLMFIPRDLWEAYGLSILMPVVSLAKMSKRLFIRKHGKDALVSLRFHIPRSRRDRALEWSYSNTTAMWDAGWEVGKRFMDLHGSDLPDRADP